MFIIFCLRSHRAVGRGRHIASRSGRRQRAIAMASGLAADWWMQLQRCHKLRGSAWLTMRFSNAPMRIAAAPHNLRPRHTASSKPARLALPSTASLIELWQATQKPLSQACRTKVCCRRPPSPMLRNIWLPLCIRPVEARSSTGRGVVLQTAAEPMRPRTRCIRAVAGDRGAAQPAVGWFAAQEGIGWLHSHPLSKYGMAPLADAWNPMLISFE